MKYGSGAEDVAAPCPSISPLLASKVDGDPERDDELFVAQAGKLAELDHVGRDRVLSGQPVGEDET